MRSPGVGVARERLDRREFCQPLLEETPVPWGERVAYAADPDGNPVTLAAPAQSA